MMCGWSLTFSASILLQFCSTFASFTLSPSPSLSCFPTKAEVTVKERLEDWLAKVFGESFPFEEDPGVEEGGVSEEQDGQDRKAEDWGDFKRDILLRLRGKTGFFELDQVLWHSNWYKSSECFQNVDSRFLSKGSRKTETTVGICPNKRGGNHKVSQ